MEPFSLGGAPVCILIAAALHLQRDQRAILLWIVAAFVLYLMVLGITIGVNVPLNDASAAVGPPKRITDLAAVRENFEAARVRWNTARAVAATAAFDCLTVALALLRSGS